jgi:membrane protease YdiL (CAAX protease family)
VGRSLAASVLLVTAGLLVTELVLRTRRSSIVTIYLHAIRDTSVWIVDGGQWISQAHVTRNVTGDKKMFCWH